MTSALKGAGLLSYPFLFISHETMGKANHVRWDEQNLGEIEANKPVRQKITEPKTPFHCAVNNEGNSCPPDHLEEYIEDHANALRSALHEVASSRKNTSPRPRSCMSSEDNSESMELDNEESDVERSGMRFREQRRTHYNEFLIMRELRGSGSFEDEDNEESENTGKDNRKREGSSGSTARP
ncbi:hypothetical protein MLD38_015666 [Melastoma candidum]|uniref:Uncharacterized protein n=1 Tax=Melastoma candidum TaxID=119954 RepID=A0ACB9RI19_9MYRT|nr:hypothetical protein MLD38_015666 [Melastoma candidum]